MDNRGIDTDPGWINRQLRELRQAIEALRSERRASATTVSGGYLVVESGIVLETNALIFSRWPAFADALRIGTLPNLANPADPGWEIFLGGSVSGGAVLHAYEFEGVKAVQVGGMAGGIGPPVDLFKAEATEVDLRASTTKISGVAYAGAPTALTLIISATTSSSANLTVDAATGAVARSTSSRRYKQDIADHDLDPTTILKMRVRTWRDRSEVEKDPDATQRYIGFIAEELHDLGLTEFVSYDEQGRPDAVAYDRIPVALLIALRWLTKQVKDERARTDALEAKVTAQQAQIDDLAAKVSALTPPTTTTGSL